MVRANRKKEGSVPVRFDNYTAGEPLHCIMGRGSHVESYRNKQSNEKLLQWHEKQKME